VGHGGLARSRTRRHLGKGRLRWDLGDQAGYVTLPDRCPAAPADGDRPGRVVEGIEFGSEARRGAEADAASGRGLRGSTSGHETRGSTSESDPRAPSRATPTTGPREPRSRSRSTRWTGRIPPTRWTGRIPPTRWTGRIPPIRSRGWSPEIGSTKDLLACALPDR